MAISEKLRTIVKPFFLLMLESLVHLFGQIDYTAIFILMAMESSILPVPSELVMIPAGWLVSTGQLDPILAILT